MRKRSLIRRCQFEFLGTFTLVFAGTGAIILDGSSDWPLGNIGVGIVFGFAIGLMVYAIRQVSGSHFNPAISFALAAYGRFRYRDVPAYIASQIGGATAASLLLLVLAGNKSQLGATAPTVTLGEALTIEIAITALLAVVVALVVSKQNLSSVTAALGVGEAVSVGAIVAGPLTGGSMNPARSFGPALATFTFEDHWVFWLGPPLGALIGIKAYMRIARSNNDGQNDPPRPS